MKNVPSSEEVYRTFLNDLVNKVFKILPIYEDCLKKQNGDLKSFHSYLDKMVTLLWGSEYFFSEPRFADIIVFLEGLRVRPDLTQKEVKSLVFHCIDGIEKMNAEG